MDERIVKFRVGVVVLATMFILAILVLLFGEIPSIVRGTKQIFIHFQTAPGVTTDTPVRKSGILIGRVTDVNFDEVRGGVIVTTDINADVPLYTTELARISGSLLGDAVIQFVPSAGPPGKDQLKDGDTIEGSVTSNPLDLLTDMQGDIGNAITSVSTANSQLGKLAERVNNLVSANEDQIARVITKSEKALDNIGAAAANFNDLLGDQQMRAELKKSIRDMPELMRQTRSAMAGIQSSVALAERNLKNMEGFTGPLGERGPAIVSKLDSSIGQLDELLVQFTEFGKNLNRREGSFGRFLNDPDLYQNLNSAAINIEKLTCELQPILRDARVITDKVARHPEVFIRGVFKPSSGIK